MAVLFMLALATSVADSCSWGSAEFGCWVQEEQAIEHPWIAIRRSRRSLIVATARDASALRVVVVPECDASSDRICRTEIHEALADGRRDGDAASCKEWIRKRPELIRQPYFVTLTIPEGNAVAPAIALCGTIPGASEHVVVETRTPRESSLGLCEAIGLLVDSGIARVPSIRRQLAQCGARGNSVEVWMRTGGGNASFPVCRVSLPPTKERSRPSIFGRVVVRPVIGGLRMGAFPIFGAKLPLLSSCSVTDLAVAWTESEWILRVLPAGATADAIE